MIFKIIKMNKILHVTTFNTILKFALNHVPYTIYLLQYYFGKTK
jgi:hypothetical protein